MSTFLNFHTRGNGKTHVYLRMMAYHGIPLIVHNYTYQRELEKQFYMWLKETAFIDKPIIYSIQKRELPYYIKGLKVIIDDPIVYEYDQYNYRKSIDRYTDDEIRDLFFEDIELGAEWMYE